MAMGVVMPDDEEMLGDVETAARVQSGGITLSEKEEGFVHSLREQFDEGRVSLTGPQRDWLKAIWDRI